MADNKSSSSSLGTYEFLPHPHKHNRGSPSPSSREALRMKPVDIYRIYSCDEKQHNGQLISVFFDRNRKLKRHADGVRLIEMFVKPRLKAVC